MKKLFMVFAMLCLMVASVSATSFYINASGSSAGPAAINLNLRDFTTVYHLDNSSAGRNSIAPPYEYQFAGEVVHFVAVPETNTIYTTQNLNVSVILVCPAGNISVPLTISSPVALNSYGMYQAEFHGDYIIPSAVALSGNCWIRVYALYAPTGSSLLDDLSALKYENVNDLLINPSFTLSESAPLSFNLVVNSYNNAVPYPQVLSISTPVDREGQGVTGNFTVYKSRLTGVTLPTFFITPDNYRYSLSSAPATWNTLTMDGSGNGYSALVGFNTGSLPTNINFYWQLYFDSTKPIQTYTGTGWYNIAIL